MIQPVEAKLSLEERAIEAMADSLSDLRGEMLAQSKLWGAL